MLERLSRWHGLAVRMHQTWTILQHNGPDCLEQAGGGANDPGQGAERGADLGSGVCVFCPPS